MADDADLLITAGFSDAKLAAEVNKVVGKFAEAGKKAQDAFNKTAEKGVENSQVVKANAREIENLKRKYDPLYAASKRYEQELDKLNRAHNVGAINAKQHEAALERLNTEFANGGRGISQVSNATRGYGSQLQQVGFQVGDFATQVGAGTSAVQALGQQLPQLLGAFGTFGALAGAGAAIMIPLGAALVRTAFDAESLEDKVESLTKTTDAYVTAAQAAATPIDELRRKYGELADEVQRVNETTLAITGAAASVALADTAKSLATQFGGLGDELVQNPFGQFLNDQTIRQIELTAKKFSREFEIAEDQALAVAEALRDLAEAGSDEQKVAAAGAALNEVLVSVAGSAEEAQRKFGDILTGPEGLGAIMEQAARQVESGISDQERAYGRLIDAYDSDTQTLKKLASDREEAERGLAQAVIDGNQEKIDSYQRILDAIDSEVVGIKTAIAEIDGSLDAFIERMKARAGEIGGGFGDAMKSYLGFDFAEFGEHANAAQKGIRELIKSVESGGDYNITLDNGAYSGGPRDLVNMTLNEVMAMQKQMLAHPDNNHNSSAAGAYQIVSKTLRSLIQELGLSGNELFSVEMQDRMADQLLRRRRGQGIEGLRNEWEGLRGVSPAVINQALGQQSIERVDPEVAKRESDALKEQADAMQRKLDLVKQFGEQLASNLLTEQQTADLAQKRADQIEAINASDMNDQEKADAIALVNAEMDRQTTILKLLEEAKRRNVDLDAQMTGSTMTYRQAIESLGEAQYAQSLANEAAKRSADDLTEAQKWANDQQKQFEEGLVDAIVSADNFGEALKNLAAQFVLAAAKALLLNGLFDSGPLGSGGGGGLLGGILSAILPGRATGGTVYAGSPYMVGEQGPEPFIPAVNGRILSVSQAQAAMRGGQSAGGTVRLVIEEGPQFASRVRAEAQGVSVETVQVYDRAIPDRVQQIRRKPRQR